MPIPMIAQRNLVPKHLQLSHISLSVNVQPLSLEALWDAIQSSCREKIMQVTKQSAAALATLIQPGCVVVKS